MADFLSRHSIWISVSLFLLSAGVIAYFGVKMTYIARDLAAATKIGEAVFGAVFIGAATSLSGITASATAAWYGDANLAVSNSLGGIAAQTMFLVLADLVYRKANLEFAAASVENLMMSAQLMLLLCILLIAFVLPEVGEFKIHPASFVLFFAYAFTVKMLVDTHEKPMWLPRMTRGTIKERNKEKTKLSQGERTSLITNFALCASMVAISGWIIANAGTVIVDQAGMSAGIVGGIFIAVATSLPELVVAITAVRLGALTLAVGDVVGGNAFDTLFIAVSDFFYREGPIYTAISSQEIVWLGSAMLMNALLLLGLLYRERTGIAKIGKESAFIMLVYICLLYTSPSPRDQRGSRMPSSA